jgi:hypothetical protein
MLKFNLFGGDGLFKQKVDSEGAASVVVHPHPPIGEEVAALPFRQFFTDDGTSTGTTSMVVNGSVTNVEYYISARQDYDIYVKYISVEIGDGGSPSLNDFGDLSALANGVSWHWFTQAEGMYELHEGIKTNKAFIRIGTDTGAIGTGTDAYLADVSGGASEKSYLPAIDIKETYGLPWGLRLRKGSTDRIIFTVNDNLSALTTFNIVGTGIRI